MQTRQAIVRGVVIGILMTLSAAAARAQGRIAVVDMQKALNECAAGKRAKDQVRSKFERAQEELRREREALDRRREDFDKKLLVLKDEERVNLERDLESRGLEFKRKYEDFQRDLKRTDAELTSGIVESIYKIVQAYGREQGMSLVLEASSGALIYSDETMDITEEVIRRVNAER